MGTFVLRRDGDTQNPTLVRAFGNQSTSGQLCYYTKIGNQTAFIVFLGEGEKYDEGEFDGIDWYKYAGFSLTPYDPVTGLGDYIFHSGKLSTGFADAMQGTPTFFPDLDFTFSGKAYCEVRLPVALSDGTDEPTRSEIRVRASRINDYDAVGAIIGGNYGPSANNLREFIYCCKLARKITPANIATRVNWPSWVTARAKCDAEIGWAAGGGDGLTGSYYADDTLTSLFATRIDGQINFAFGTGETDLPPVPFSVRWTGFVEAPATGTFTFTARYDDGIKVWINGVLLINDWTVGPTRESSGTIALTIGTRYTVTIEYLNAVLSGEASLSYECAGAGLAKQVVPRDRLFSSSTTNSAGRSINRYDGDLVFPGTPLPTALAAIMSKCPGIEWQEIGGKITFLSDTNRASVFTFYYDPTQSVTPANIVAKSFVGSPRDPLTTPNFLIVGYRDKDDELFTQKYVPIDRPDRRDQLNGQIVDAGILQIGVARQSLAERVGESMIRLTTDLDLDCTVKGQKGAHRVAKSDRVTLVHPVGDWRGTAFAGHSGPIDMLVQEETFESTIETANEKTFKLREYDPDYYSDTKHGPLARKRIVDVESPYARPPIVTSIALSQFAAALADGSFAITIEGEVQAAQWGYEQRLRLWWQRPSNYISGLVVSTGANTITTPAAHKFGDNQPVELSGGTLPGGTVPDKVYYALIVSPTVIRLSLKPDGEAIDLTSAGAGFSLAPYFADDKLLTPSRTTLQASFELAPAEVGVHKIRVVSESRTQQHYAIGVHTVASITTTMPDTEQPSTLLGFFDEHNGGVLTEWTQGFVPILDKLEVYDLEFNYDNPDPAKVRRETIMPTFNRILQEYVVLDPASYTGIGPPTDYFHLLNNGGAEIYAGQSLKSKAGAEVVGGLLVRFVVPARNYLPMRNLAVLPATDFSPDVDTSFSWTAFGVYPNWFAIPEDDFYDTASPTISIVAGMSLDIFFRADGRVEYHTNYSPFSRPVWISGKRVDLSTKYKVYISGPGRIESISWMREGPEYMYDALAQRTDLGLASTDPLPSEIKARVRQRSQYVGGPPSPWTSATLVRP